ncbi:hypothetical protein LZ32DRAFT_684375 [Colletotrichum eremochloae]|nr:hypothetical protein LZ32DRAFT_684375 [Colletotrichum eremochloae]
MILSIRDQEDTATCLVDQIARLLPAAWQCPLRVVPSIDNIALDDPSLNRAEVVCLHGQEKPLFEVRISRVMPASGLNERFSARDRSIVKPAIVARDAAVQVVANGNEKMKLWSFIDHSSGIMRMKVEFALHIPSSCSKASSSPAYISHGRVGEDWTMEISSANVSRLDLQPEDVVSLGRLCATPASIEATAPNISSYG